MPASEKESPGAPRDRAGCAVRPVRPRERFLVFAAPVIEDAEIAEVVATLRSGWLGTGPRVARFERDFEAFKGARHAVAVSSCSAALHLGLLAAGVRPGDEVITTALTFCATVNAISHAGAVPVLVDVDRASMNIAPGQVEARITSRTRAIIPVHFAGRPCAMDALCEVAARHGLKIIEDCAHAIEAHYKGRPTGAFGDFGAFSFYVTKNVVTGEGGMVLARRAEDAARIRILSLHGMSRDAWRRFGEDGYTHYDVVDAGFKYNMSDLEAAIGIHQLRRVESNWRRRRDIWQQYDLALRDLPLRTPRPPEPGTRHAYHLYTILVDEQIAGVSRDVFLTAMTAHNIGVGVHYISVPEHRYYQRRYGWKPEDFPEAAYIGQRTVSLPISAGMSDEDVADVISAVVRILENPSRPVPAEHA